MRGCQKLTVLVLLGAVFVVFYTLLQMLEGVTDLPASTPSPLVLHTPTSTATATPAVMPAEPGQPTESPEPQPTQTSTPTVVPSDTPTETTIPPTPTSTPAPTATATQPPSPTPMPQSTAPAEVADYLDAFVPLVSDVREMSILGDPPGPVSEGTADRLRDIYSQLHEMPVPDDAQEMHLAFITYVSVLEEKCLCHVFAEAQSDDAQAQHFRECEDRSTTMAAQILNSRFIPSRDAFLQAYSLTAGDAGFP